MVGEGEEDFQIFLKSISGKTRPIGMNGPRDTIQMLKEKVEEKESVRPDNQRLIYGGHQLEDHKTLEEYSIEKDCKVWLVLRVRGG
ncbi:Rnf4 Ubch5a ubiquitin heterotrimeric complex [Serendipita vermifera]|nr:Rnf4 Ubch5a ubiquitin heterotrimeric complex [Serendipita vermifera]